MGLSFISIQDHTNRASYGASPAGLAPGALNAGDDVVADSRIADGGRAEVSEAVDRRAQVRQDAAATRAETHVPLDPPVTTGIEIVVEVVRQQGADLFARARVTHEWDSETWCHHIDLDPATESPDSRLPITAERAPPVYDAEPSAPGAGGS